MKSDSAASLRLQAADFQRLATEARSLAVAKQLRHLAEGCLRLAAAVAARRIGANENRAGDPAARPARRLAGRRLR